MSSSSSCSSSSCVEDRKSADKAVERIKTQLHAAEQFVKVGMAPYANVLQNKTELLRRNSKSSASKTTFATPKCSLPNIWD